MSTVRGIRIDADIQQRLQKVAEGMDRTEQWVIRTALVEYLDEAEEQLETMSVCEARWQEYLITGESIPNEEVMEWLEKGAKGLPAKKPQLSGSSKQ